MTKKAEVDCYVSAYRFTLRMLGKGNNVRLVHGLPTLSVEPRKKYGHAWVEFELGIAEGVVVDTLTSTIIKKELYYKEGKIDSKECDYYSPEEALAASFIAGTYGPWVDRGGLFENA